LEFYHNKQHSIGRPRLSISTAPRPVGLGGDQMPQAVARLLAVLDKTPDSKLTPEQRTILLRWYRTIDPQWQELHKKAGQQWKAEPRPPMAKMLICSEGVKPLRLHTQGEDFFDKTYHLKRGDVNQKEGEATQSFLQVLMRKADEKRWQTAPPKGWRTSYR